MKMLESVSPRQCRIEHKQGGRHPGTQLLYQTGEHKTSASCAMISPKKGDFAGKDNHQFRGIIGRIPRDKCGSSKPTVIQP